MTVISNCSFPCVFRSIINDEVYSRICSSCIRFTGFELVQNHFFEVSYSVELTCIFHHVNSFEVFACSSSDNSFHNECSYTSSTIISCCILMESILIAVSNICYA